MKRGHWLVVVLPLVLNACGRGTMEAGKEGDALASAAAEGDVITVAHLLETGTPPDARDSAGRTALYYATMRGQAAAGALLLDAGADLDIKQGPLGPALIYALQTNKKSMVQVLLKKGADPNTKSPAGRPALFYAATSELKSILLKAGAAPLEGKAHEKLKAMAKKEALSGSAKLANRARPVILAVKAGDENALISLLNQGYQAEAMDESGFLPLFWAPSPRMVDVLLEAGAKVDTASSKNGLTALHWLARTGNAAVVASLISHGAPVNARDQAGSTPLHFAAAAGHGEVVSLLLRHGADASLKDAAGRTAGDRAREGGHEEIAGGLRK